MTQTNLLDPRITDALRRYRSWLPEAVTHVQAETDQPVEVIVDPEANVTDALSRAIPELLGIIAPFISERKLNVLKVTAAITAISALVARVAPTLKGASARAVVLALFDIAWEQQLVRLLPVWLRPFSGALKRAAVDALQVAYDTTVKKLKK